MKHVRNIRGYYTIALAAGLFACFFSACSKQGDRIISPPKLAGDTITVQNVTYTNYVTNVLKNNCSTCHGANGSAPQYWFNTNTYGNAVQYGTRIVETIEEGSMPPVPRKPFSQTDKALLSAWLSKGMPL